ncbi:histidine kinase [Nonomuraea sp. 3-1Str]|uniref:sensor histidine kinase n=1 Tax=Nonomuraea sp. 3-1Str TaxID=2929801 RepID=UPI00285C7F2C|nr:histidine kinase [Nonomuraea sp. 3-1Str]MDR8409412.1 histidine kinase [Nonomuraea sp. 3-1Str]
MRKNLPRRWACLILGGALLMPYMMAGALVAGLVRGEGAGLLMPVQVGVFVAVLPVVAVTGLFLPVRGLEVSAAQGLLGARVETPPREARRSWQERRRTASWFTLHLAVGGVVSGFTLAVVPFTVYTLALPVVGAPSRGVAVEILGQEVRPGWQVLAWTLAGVVALVALVLMAAGAGGLLARLAPVLLGPTPGERLAAAEERARVLAERNRLARELHDSVGHALSVVTLQAAAAGRVLDRDPGTARTALEAIERSARAALEDLDHALGVLRAGDPPRPARAPAPRIREEWATLKDLDALVAASGASVEREVGDVSAVPAPISREAYRIVQEALTNAIRHGHGTVRLAVAVRDGDLRLEVANRTAASSGGTGAAVGGGRGLAGMRERVRLLSGELEAGPADACDGAPEGWWRVTARLPLRSAP